MASVGKGTDSQTELTSSDQQNFKPILSDIVPLIGDTVEVRSEFRALPLPLAPPIPQQISMAPVIELCFVFVQ